MTEQEMMQIMVKTVNLVCSDLTDEELAVLNLVAQLDQNPKGRLFDYEKVKSLFTENRGAMMHDVTKDALARVVNQRLDANG